MTYKYDKNGNIIEIRENELLLARYQYDALSRLIREYIAKLAKTSTYSYDAWSNHKTFVLDNEQFVDISTQTSYTQSGLNNKTTSLLNPFRYRGYYYNVETSLYYLNNRCYDLELGKLINDFYCVTIFILFLTIIFIFIIIFFKSKYVLNFHNIGVKYNADFFGRFITKCKK